MARFPWDPKPDPPPPAQAAPAAQGSSNQSHTLAHYSPQLSLPNVGGGPAQNGVKQDSGFVKQENIKQEPGSLASAIPPYPNYNGAENKTSVAASRAAQQLQLQYGMRAAGSINAIQDRMGQQQPGQAGNQGEPMANASAQQQQQPPAGADAANHISNGQTDGAGDDDDYEGVLLQRGATGNVHELGRVEIDRMLHEQIAARAKAMEGGGLMLPLKEATRHRTAPAKRGKGKGVAAFDGGNEDDDDIDDEDAINSDLDDPEEDRDDDEVDDEGLGHIMLCMYDKVQRVKNKWYVVNPLP